MDRSELKETNKLFRQQLGKFFIDLSKLTFAGAVIGGAMQVTQVSENTVPFIMIALGAVVSAVFAFVGVLILK